MGAKSVEIYDLLKIIKILVFYTINEVIFSVKILLVTTDDLNMYNLIAKPSRRYNQSDNHSMKILEIETPFIEIT